MAKGVSIKFKSYAETIPKLLNLIKFDQEIKKHSKIILKPNLSLDEKKSTSLELMEEVLKFCVKNKNPVSEIFIAEGADGLDTLDLFESLGYKNLAEKYSLGLVDLNNAETEVMADPDFLKFDRIMYPTILEESFIVSLPKLSVNEETGISGSISNMLGAFPSKHYSGLFSSKKSKIRKWPIEYSIHDIILCKEPDFALIDASEEGSILAGQPLEMDKQASKLLGIEWKNIPYIRLIDEVLSSSSIDTLIR